ncbi:hypothetical protein [Jiangella asiatica]|uniref:Uncharacterized protein n=1 Tax=Jiangella asiatica TaxID=2530372 RepID=A0A4R5CWA6_9ACTN|nr:hypothetical protein [Jiangella asiatica]TDE02814.1 hypothetical protein E1269_21215 [Jiangella asiatica]
MAAHRAPRSRPRHARRSARRPRGLRFLIPLLALAVAFVGGVATATAGGGYLREADVDNPIASRGCVIRFDTLSRSGASVVPRIHANETHACVGVTSLSVDWSSGSSRGDLILNNTGGPGAVVSVTVEEDESLAARDIQCGPSGGGTTTRIRCYRDGVKIPAYSLEMYGKNVNLWVGWDMWMGEL